MFSSFAFRRSVWIALVAFVLSAPVFAQDGTAPGNQSGDPATPENPTAPTPTATPAEETPATGLALGADLYYGTSNYPGIHRFRDGFWLGYGAFYPSVVYANYNDRSGTSGRVSLGLGKLYNGSISGFDQPVEAFVSKPIGKSGKTTLTAGKFFVPFELAEWEYESEWGLQTSHDWGKNGALTGAVTYNRLRENPNYYARYSRTFGPATLGLSLGGGRGFIGDTDHDRGAALDLTVTHRRFWLEAMTMLLDDKNTDNSKFRFSFVRLNYHLDPKTNMYISRHSWFDRLDQQTNGQFSTFGVAHQLTKNLAIEGALSKSGELNRTINWIQLHYTIER